MRHLIVGTAGHIDHGKTALVRALTGVDTDRLEEEKRRGISIDLGFAHLDLTPELRLGFVDVPGHERFIKNMLAGVGGIDLVLFVVAADESIKPQTREHFDICRLLNIRKGIVVLTKADLVDPDILGLVRLEVEEFVRGSFLEGAPIVAVSSTTGAGLNELRRSITDMAGAIPPKDVTHYFRLPIDRSFSMRGFGTVVTGTLVAGSVSVEQEVEIHPDGRRVRVRGLQVHGQPVERACAGQRTAVNLAGVEASDLHRGMVLAEAGRFQSTRQVDCVFELLPDAHPLKHRAPVHFHAGTAEVEADIRLMESLEPMRPGSSAVVRFLLHKPLLALPGDRFIVRMFSPVVTIGGGTVLDIASPPRIRRADAALRLRALAQGSVGDRVALLVREARYGLSIADLVARTGLLEADLIKGAQSDRLLYLGEPYRWVLDRQWADETLAQLREMVGAFHRQKPLVPGMAKEELRSRELPDAPPFLLDALIARAKDVVVEGDLVRLAAHRVALRQDEEEALAKIEAAFAQAGLAAPATQEVLAKSGVESARARSLLQILVRNRRVVRVGDDLVFHSEAIQKLRELLVQQKGRRFSVAEFKDWTGISRKYAIPLLEFLDRERVTRRDGDSRVVL